jgi:hypothetical protein
MKNNTIKIQNLFTLLFISAAMLFTACKKDNGGSTASAHIRIVNAFQGSAAQDLYLDNVKVNSSAVAYAQNTDYMSAVAGSHTAKFANSGSTTANVSFSLALKASGYYTVYYTSNDTTKSAVVTQDRTTSAVTGKAKVRFVLLSSAAASAVDFGISNASKLVTNLAYKVVSDYYTVDANTAFSLYAAGSQSVLLNIPTSVQSGKIYTVYISGSTALTLSSRVIAEN